MLFPAPLWVLGPPSPRAPTPLGAPGGTLAPINPPTLHLHPPLLETHVSQGVGVGPPLQPVPHPHPCQASLGFGERGCGNPQGCCFPHTPQPPAPSPALLPQQRLGNMEEAGRGGGVHECPSAHNFVQQPLLPVSWGLSGSCPAAPAVLLGDKVGTITAGTESGPSMAGGMRTEPPPPGAGMDKMLAALTGCSRQGDRLGPAACACLQLAVDGGGVVSLLGARKQGPPHPEPPTFCRGMVAAAPWLGTWWPWKVPFNVTSWHLPIHPRSQEPCPGGWGLWKGAAAPSSGDVRDMEGPSAWREGLKAGAWPQHEPNSASASLCNWPGTKFDPGPSASHTHASLGGFSFGSWRKMALAEHPHWRGR